MTQAGLIPADYSSDAVLNESTSQAAFRLRIAMASQLVAQQYESDQHQDIEGVVTTDGSIYIVQTRPQA